MCKFKHLEDRKRALVSQLLQRACCQHALGVPFQEVALSRTKGGKPFLARARVLASGFAAATLTHA